MIETGPAGLRITFGERMFGKEPTAKTTASDPETQLGSGPSTSPDLEATLSSSVAFGFSPLDGKTAKNPTAIGPYKLNRRLGEGGMGQVWLAEQTEPVQRTVALKLIRVGMYDDEVLQRFRAERQSLAMMDHPAIAKIFDAGATPDGQPYFVMEYVPGVPITQYCDEKKLTIAQRLDLFSKVCEGVQHAHQKAIIHRDLKPANILVSEVDGKPMPRIIDFGLAKATGPQVGDAAMMTMVGGFVGTLGYMSPEQASGTGDVDTRTDVYSLGVVLYVLLTGDQPFDTSQWKSMPLYEVIQQLKEVDPPRPSTKIRGDKASLQSSEARGVQVAQLQKLLHGDLDWITMKALEKDRARRYSTPMDLAADVGRYLNNEAVQAVPPSLTYRAAKFIRRNRLVLGTAAVIAVILVSATVISIRQSMRASREGAVAQAVSEFLQNDLLAQASARNQSAPNSKPDPNLTVRSALDRAAQRIEGKFSKQPEVEVAIRNTIGSAYADLGLYLEARQQLERALDLGNRSLGSDNPATLTALHRLGWVASLQGKYPEAEALITRAVESRRSVLGPEHPDTLRSMNTLATIYDSEGKYAQAEALYSQLLQIRKRVLGPEHRDTLLSASNLGGVYAEEGKYSRAEGLLTQTVEIQKHVLGPEHPDTLKGISNLAYIQELEGKYAQAEALYTQEIEIEKRVLGPEHPGTLVSMGNLARVIYSEGKYAQAEKLDLRVLQIQSRVLGPEHPDTLRSMDRLATDYNLEHKYAQGDALYSEALEIQKRVLGPEHPDTLTLMGNLAENYTEEGKLDEAEKIFHTLLSIEQKVFGPENSNTAVTKYNMGCLEARRGNKDRAFDLLRDAIDHGLMPSGDLGLENDTDLTSLHNDPRWPAIVAHAKQLAQSKSAPPQAK